MITPKTSYFYLLRSIYAKHWKIPSRNSLGEKFIVSRVRKDMEYYNMKAPLSPRVTLFKEVRAKYLDGKKSIFQNLPMPTPSIKTLFPNTDKATLFAHIPVNVICGHNWSHS